MKVLVATQKPFSAAAVAGIREIIEASGNEFAALEKYPEQADLVAAVRDVDALIIRSDKVTAEVLDAAPISRSSSAPVQATTMSTWKQQPPTMSW